MTELQAWILLGFLILALSVMIGVWAYGKIDRLPTEGDLLYRRNIAEEIWTVCSRALNNPDVEKVTLGMSSYSNKQDLVTYTLGKLVIRFYIDWNAENMLIDYNCTTPQTVWYEKRKFKFKNGAPDYTQLQLELENLGEQLVEELKLNQDQNFFQSFIFILMRTEIYGILFL